MRIKDRLAFIALAAFLLLLPVSGLTDKEIKISREDMQIIARVTANILGREHYRQQELDDEMSGRLFHFFFKRNDPQKIFFTKDDISSFRAESQKLDDQLLAGEIDFAFRVFGLLKKRIEKYEEFVKGEIEKDMDFTVDEEYELDRADSDWPENEKAQLELWRKKVKNDILAMRLISRTAKELGDNGEDGEKYRHLWELANPEKRLLKNIDNLKNIILNKTDLEILEIYLNSLTNIYDPHSAYMRPRTVEDFNISMRLSLVGIGAILTISDNGMTKIVKIIPGGPADINGRLRPEDRIIAVAQGDEDPVDVVDMPLDKVVNLIRGKKGTVVRLTVLQGSKGLASVPKVISIKRDTVKLTEQESKGTVKTLPNGFKLGVLDIPSFYLDFAAILKGDSDYKSSTRDVKKILEEFKQENVQGILIDLRSNSGGSLLEAIALSGLFIEDGPIVQVGLPDGEREIKTDPDSGISYSGPLVVLVNKFSASAAEIFAGAMKDYNRAVIVGDKHTHGKGTVQTIYNLDDVLRHYGVKAPAGSVKVTSAVYYRINGDSTQLRGVSPHIEFPSFYSNIRKVGEKHLDYALPWDKLEAAGHEDFGNVEKYVPELRTRFETRINSNEKFMKLNENIEVFNSLMNRKKVSLNEEKRWERIKSERAKEQEILKQVKTLINGSEDNKNRDEAFQDIYLKESLGILSDLIKLQAGDSPEK